MIGKTLGNYRVGEQLGRGGMGEVYVADDLNLNRKVALKFLPDAFAGDPERMARFEREAKLLASLNHPNIAAIYGLEQAEGKRFIVLELVEGETLAQRISKGALPVDEALAICRQIAEGLEAAHEKGVIHRDLKPANVMITGEDKVKILDFGLAKALSDETPAVDSSQSPTLTEAMTRPGVILGTAAYMSPEQAKGKTVDKRADIWAFGCILYECLTGKRVFEGETVTETLAAVLTKNPEWDKIPANAQTLLRRCLEKDRNQRLRDIGDVRIELDTTEIIEDDSEWTSSDRMAGLKRHSLWIMTLLSLATVIALAAAYYFAGRALSPPRAQEVLASLSPNPGVTLSGIYSLPALSPDGTRFVFPALDKQGVRSLWLRSLRDPDPVRLTGTDWASYPFWSPDGKFIGFFANDQLRTIEAAGGPARILCSNIVNGCGASWSSSGVIVLAANGILLRVKDSGGNCEPLNQEHATRAMRPAFLDDGRKFLFFNLSTTGMVPIFVGDLQTGKSQQLMPRASNPLFVPPHWLLHMEQNRTIYGSRFEPSSLRIIGDAVLLLDGVASPDGFAAYTAAGNALVALQNVGSLPHYLSWMDRRGQTRKLMEIKTDMLWGGISLSSGSQRLALSGWGLWIHDIDSGVATRVPAETSPGFPEAIQFPAWSPRGDLIAYSSRAGAKGAALRLFRPNEGTNEPILQLKAKYVNQLDWFPGGESLAVVIEGEPGPSRIEVISVSVGDRKIQPLWTSAYPITELRVSPDGQWLAYVSDETGRSEVFVRRILGQAGAAQVSLAGGKQPHWRADGKAIFYLGLDSSIMEVGVQTSPRLASFPPKAIVQAAQDSTMDLYAVSKDTQQFLVLVNPQPSSYALMLNWTSRIEKRSK